jgi:hypothetical protein
MILLENMRHILSFKRLKFNIQRPLWSESEKGLLICVIITTDWPGATNLASM